MHALHRILVKLEDEDETIDEIRSVAKSETEDYYNAYDWRETDTAGRCESEYPCNVDSVKKITNSIVNAEEDFVESLKDFL